MIPDFQDMRVDAPDIDALRETFDDLHQRLTDAVDITALRAIYQDWNDLRREVWTWRALATVRFRQNTTDPQARSDRELADRLSADLTELDTRWKKALIGAPQRALVEEIVGTHVMKRWEMAATTYAPAIASDFVREKALCAEYTDLVAAAQIAFRGERHNLSTLDKLAVDPDRTTRRDAVGAQWAWFEEHGSALDTQYDELVTARTRMARTLGAEGYIDLGYRRMTRIGYDAQDVARFREEVREHVVPICAEIRSHQATTLGIDEVRFWDEGIHNTNGDPSPNGDMAWIAERASEAYHALDPRIGDFYDVMQRHGLMDLPTREGKAAGGFCTGLSRWRVPFIFANFNGTRRDIRTLNHEMGHAFQGWMCRNFEVLDAAHATMEVAEIHSMSLEYLMWPQLHRFFGERANDVKRLHLADSLCFLPYGVAIDHFQHLVYERPEAAPAERHAMWREMEARYLPWRNYGDVPRLNQGGLWQRQRHIYLYPFYYIDYTLALTCALQLWAWSRRDAREAFDAYIALCGRGGSISFADVVSSSGLTSPFERGFLGHVAKEARDVLNGAES